MTMCAQRGRGALVRKKVTNIEHTVLEDCVNKDIESFVARVWEEIEQQYLPSVLEDWESWIFLPVEFRMKGGGEPLFLVRYE